VGTEGGGENMKKARAEGTSVNIIKKKRRRTDRDETTLRSGDSYGAVSVLKGGRGFRKLKGEKDYRVDRDRGLVENEEKAEEGPI